jgi:hypothetical protein
MRLETLPLILGGLVGLVGVLLVLDAWLPDDLIPLERRTRPRRGRDRGGEALVGFGSIAMGAAFVGRDTWRYGTIAAILGTILVVIGVAQNRAYLRELFSRADWRGRRKTPRAADARPLVTPTRFSDGSRRIR